MATAVIINPVMEQEVDYGAMVAALSGLEEADTYTRGNRGPNTDFQERVNFKKSKFKFLMKGKFVKRSVVLIIVVGFLVLMIGSVATVVHRQNVIDSKYAEASGGPLYLKGDAHAEEAVDELSKYHSEQATTYLYWLATNKGFLVDDNVQLEAIKMLRYHSEEKIIDGLASMLQPQEPLNVRLAVTQTLDNMPLDRQAIASMLHYRERLWWGELNVEDNYIKKSSDYAEHVLSQQKELHDAINSTLLHDEQDTLDILKNNYGLGLDVPSKFALYIVTDLKMNHACQLLEQSANGAKQKSQLKLLSQSPQKEIDDALSSLKCNVTK